MGGGSAEISTCIKNLYIYIYTHIHIYIYICIHIYMYIYIYNVQSLHVKPPLAHSGPLPERSRSAASVAGHARRLMGYLQVVLQVRVASFG